jgi:hypothetical protein
LLYPCTKLLEQGRYLGSSGQPGGGMSGMVVVTAHRIGAGSTLQ